MMWYESKIQVQWQNRQSKAMLPAQDSNGSYEDPHLHHLFLCCMQFLPHGRTHLRDSESSQKIQIVLEQLGLLKVEMCLERWAELCLLLNMVEKESRRGKQCRNRIMCVHEVKACW